MVFPNSKPSWFSNESDRHAKFVEIKEKRIDAAKKLNISLPQYFYALERDDQILKQDIQKIKKLKADLK
jgi:hypothetical protein